MRLVLAHPHSNGTGTWRPTDSRVTGANRGIGLAIVRRCLSDHIDTHVILACRRALAGGEAAASLIADRPDWKARLTVLEMDTSSDSSVIAAAAKLEADFGRTLYAIVNAGIASGARIGVVAARVAARIGFLAGLLCYS